eukprot:jgi/Botrbrau1/13133/Bobra.0187s0088.1
MMSVSTFQSWSPHDPPSAVVRTNCSTQVVMSVLTCSLFSSDRQLLCACSRYWSVSLGPAGRLVASAHREIPVGQIYFDRSKLHHVVRKFRFNNPVRRRICAAVSQTNLAPKSVNQKRYSGVFLLLILNIGVFLASNVLHMGWTRSLYLYHAAPRWWAFLTSAFCHASWEHLSSNIFLLLIFGKAVEEEEGATGVWLTYLLTALGASLASFLLMPRNSISLGASGAVFGLFIVSIFARLKWDPRRLLEAAILGNFVTQQVFQEIRAQSAVLAGKGAATVGGAQVAHVAHLAGALAGVLLVYIISRLPDPEGQQTKKNGKD